MMGERRNKYSGLLGTLLLHVLLFLLLWLFSIRASEQQEESGVPVLLGMEQLASGDGDKFQMTKVEVTSVPEPVPSVPETSPSPVGEEIISQEVEETVVIEQKKPEPKKETAPQRKPEKVAVEKPKEKSEAEIQAERKAAAEAAAAQAAAKSIAGAFGKGASMENRGEAEQGKGIQGSTEGNSETGKTEGAGGYGSFDLNGRTLGDGGLPRPDYRVQDEGRVVVTIIVNPAGQVINASVHKRTNTANPQLRKAAIEAARKARFNAVDGVNNQSGTITYYFKLK